MIEAALFAPATSFSRALNQQARERIGAAKWRWFEWDAGAGGCLAGDGVTLGGESLTRLKTAWVQGFSFQSPVIPPEAGVQRDWSVWQVDHLLAQQSYSQQCSLLREMQRRGVRVVNGFSAHLDHFMKPALLSRLAQGESQEVSQNRASPAVGPDQGWWRLPDMIATNDAEEAKAFGERHGEIIWRPVTGRAAWQLFRERQRLALMGPDQPPVLLAAIVPGALRRSFVLNGNLLASLELAAPSAALPGRERLEMVRPIRVSPRSAAALRALAETLGWDWVEIHWVQGGDGAVWIYDVDPDPALDWLPEDLQAFLARGAAAFLAGEDAPTPLEEAEWRPRATPFLRRMLLTPFEFERVKCADAGP